MAVADNTPVDGRTVAERRLRRLIIVVVILLGIGAGFLIFKSISERNRPPHSYATFMERIWLDALEKNPNNPSILTNLGYVYMKEGMTSRALGYFNEALRHSPKFFPAWYNLGIYYKQNKQYREAMAALKRAASYAPVGNRYLAYFSIGEIQEAQGHLDKAVETYRKSLEDNDTMWNIYYRLGLVYEKKGDKQQALQNYQQAARYVPGNDKLERAIRRVSKP